MQHEADYRNLKLHERRFEELKQQLPLEAHGTLDRALALAEHAHTGQTRDEGDPYIIHPIRAANALMEHVHCKDASIIAATLLHDVVEDSEVTLDDIRAQFGDHIATLVEGVTRDKEGGESKESEIQKIIGGSMDIRLIKAADKLDNLISYQLRSDRGDRWKRHLTEARTLFLPLARSTANQYLIDAMEEAYEQVPDKEMEYQ